MIDPWRRAPAWLLGVVMGAFFSLVMTVVMANHYGSWTGAILGGGIAGVIFGTVMGPYTARLHARDRQAAGTDERTYTAATAGLRRKARLPRDSATRNAAAAVAGHRLEMLEHQRVWATVLFSVLAVVSALLAVTGSSWHWLEVALFCASPLASWQQRRRLRQRIVVLSAAHPT